MRNRSLLIALMALVPASARAQEGKGRDSAADKAVERALEYLYNAQDKGDGAWRLNGQKSPAPTALGVMAFLWAGHVPGEGKYGESVEKGIRWVMKQQSPRNGLIGANHHHEMYHHGICTLMLAEAAGMVDGELAKDVRKALAAAVKLILQAQRVTGEERSGSAHAVAHHGLSRMSLTRWQVKRPPHSQDDGRGVSPEP